MKTIQRIFEIPLEEVQTEEAKRKDTSIGECCLVCGKKIKGNAHKYVQLLTNGNIVSSEEDFTNSQGFFPVGNDCAKRLVIKFAF